MIDFIVEITTLISVENGSFPMINETFEHSRIQ